MVGKTALEGFQRPDNAERVRAVVESIAQQVAEGLAYYRMATVVTINPESLEVEFADEPGSTILIDNLDQFRPASIGQNIEVLVRNGTDYSVWRIFGDVVTYGVTPYLAPVTAAVTGLGLATANRSIVASWDALEGATSYDVQRAKDSGFTTSLATSTVIGTQFTATNLTPGDGWWYRVRGKNASGSGSWSSVESIVVSTDTPAATIPPVPGTPTIVNGELSQSVTWANSDGADYYELQWSLSSTFASGITTQVVQSNNYVRHSLTAGNTWYYRVRAVNTAGSSAYSGISAGSTATSNIPAPAGVPVQVVGMAASSAERSITVLWTPQAVATSYEVERSKSATFASGNVLQEVAGSVLTINNLIADESWYFRTRGKNAAGTGPYSATLGPIVVNTDTPDPDAPAQVGSLTLTTIPNQVTAVWGMTQYADYYQLQYSVNSGFTTGVTTINTETNSAVVNNLTPGVQYFFRVRAVNMTSGSGAYSAGASIVVMLPSDVTDGNAPTGSSTTTVTAGIGMLTATWPKVSNSDRVTYEVYISTTSGFLTLDATTKLGETDGTFWITDKLPNGTKLVVGTTYFMRVRARDEDGTGPLGAQGSATLVKVDLGAAGDFDYSQLTGDGSIPGTPAAPTVSSGIGYLYAKWTRPTSADPLTYEVHVGTSSGFVPDANTLSVVTDSLFAFIRKQGPGAGSADLVYGTTYWIKIIAKDIDGVSAPSNGTSGFTVQANTADIAVNAITAASGIIANLAVGEAQIAGLAVTEAKIGALAVSSAKIADLAVTTAKIADLAVTTAKIQDLHVTTAKINSLAVTNAKINDLAAGKITTDTLTATVTVSGVIRSSASTARVEMSSAGLYAYNSGGGTTFSIDSAGNAYFQGNVYAVNGTFTGSITSSAEITGGIIRSASSGARISIGPLSYSFSEMGSTYTFGPYPALSWHDSGNTVRHLIYGDGTSLFIERPGYGSVSISATRLYVTLPYTTFSNYIDAGGVYDFGYRVYSPLNPQNTSHNHSGVYEPVHSHPYASSSHSHSGESWSSLTLSNLYSGGNHMVGYSGTGMALYYAGGGTRVACQSGNKIFMKRVDDAAWAAVDGGAYTNVSSRSFKKNVRVMGTAFKDQSGRPNRGTDIAKLMRPVIYKPIAEYEDKWNKDKDRIGFIAEELQDVLPEAVNIAGMDGETLGIDYASVTAFLTLTVQELLDRIETLENRPPIPTPN